MKAIDQRLKAIPTQQASFAHLSQSLAMLRVEMWLGVLLGEFELEAGEEFYSDALWVKTTAVDPPATIAPSRPVDACQN